RKHELLLSDNVWAQPNTPAQFPFWYFDAAFRLLKPIDLTKGSPSAIHLNGECRVPAVNLGLQGFTSQIETHVEPVSRSARAHDCSELYAAVWIVRRDRVKHRVRKATPCHSAVPSPLLF